MMIPTIHLNGSSRQHLLDGYKDAYYALHLAIEKLTEASPNARDYYVQGPDAFKGAVAEHADRMARLTSVKDELGALCRAVANEEVSRG